MDLEVRLIMIITADKIRKAIPILFRKGISGNQNLNAVDNGMVSRAVINAAVGYDKLKEAIEVARQKS